MKIGAQDRRSSAISAANADAILVRGHDLCGELIGRITFTDHAWLLVTGSLPSPAQRRMLDATLVAIAEHGLVPSVAAARITLAAAPEALQGAVAAGILGCGSVILGSAESAARLLTDILARAAADGPEAAARTCDRRSARGTARGARLRPPAAQEAGPARRRACLRSRRRPASPAGTSRRRCWSRSCCRPSPASRSR